MLTDVENDTGGQVVAGSNPVSPTRKQALTCGDPHQAHGTGGPFWDQYANAYANQDLPAAETMAVFETFPQKPCDEVFRLE